MGNIVEKTTIKYSLSECLYIISLSLILILKGFGGYDGQLAFKVIMPVALSLILIKYIIEEHSVKEVVLSGLLVTFFCGIFFVTKNKGYIIGIALFLGMKDIAMKNLFRCGAIFASLSMVISYILSCLGIRMGDVRLHYKLGGEILRYSFGNSHPNNMHMTFVIMCILLLYSLKDDKNKLKRWNVILMVISGWLGLYTLSYTGLLLSILIFVGVLYHCFAPRNIHVVEKIVAYLVLCGCLVFSSIFPVVLTHSPNLFEKVNRIFHTRLSLLLTYYDAYDVLLIPQRINDYTLVVYQQDNSFAELLLEGGLVVFILFIIGVTLVIHSLIKRNDRLAIVFIVVQLIGGLTDPYLFNSSSRNLIILWMGQYYFEWFKVDKAGLIINLSIFDKVRNKRLVIPSVVCNVTQIRRYVIKVIILSVMVASLLTAIISINKKWPVAYGVEQKKFEALFFDDEQNIKMAEYAEIAEDDSILIYNVSEPQTKVVYFNTPRMLVIEKVRYYMLLFINISILLVVVMFLAGNRYITNAKR